MDTSSRCEIAPDVCEAIAFVGQTLSPLFLYDPDHEATSVVPLIEQLALLDASEAGRDWPFVSDEEAYQAFLLIQGSVGKDTRENGMFKDDGSVRVLSSEEISTLVWEYRRLFVGPQLLPAPPWGSVYTDRDGVIFGNSCLDLRQWMREQDIGLENGKNEPEDHIGLLLALMSHLAKEKPALLKEFLSEHVLPWSGHYLDLLYRAANEDFYKGVALLANRSLEGIRSELALEVSPARFFR